MIDLIPGIQHHFDALQDRMTYFVTYESQCEGWFKGELYVILSQQAEAGMIQRLVSENNADLLGRRKVDLIVSQNNDFHYIELKHWLIGSQKGQIYGPAWYARDKQNGIVNDVAKLSSLNRPGNSWLLLLLTVNPGAEAWAQAVAVFNKTYPLYRVTSFTDPSLFSKSYFIGLLGVSSTSPDP